MDNFELTTMRPEQLEIPPDELAELRAIISSVRWKFAWTMRWAPHWYVMTVIDKPLGHIDPEPYDRIGRAIHEYGYDASFGKTPYRYLNIDGWKYWLMGPYGHPLNTIVNRAKLKGHPRWMRSPDDMGWIENPDWHPAPESPQMEVVETPTKKSTRLQLRLDEK